MPSHCQDCGTTEEANAENQGYSSCCGQIIVADCESTCRHGRTV